MALLDDHSRVCCHAQWYLDETAEELIHALIQAILKRGLPRSILMDNGSAMIAAETQQGLERLGVSVHYTQVESPYQNGKQEAFFAPVEGQLVAMLEGVEKLDLALLNHATIAWVERGYHRSLHRELGESPLDRLRAADSVARPAPSVEALRNAFRQDVRRKQRRSDGTLSLEGKRFEIPSRFRHIEWLTVRYARFDLSRVSLIDPRHDIELCRIYPLDKRRNASGHRASLGPVTDEPPPPSGIAPHLQRLMNEYDATGRPPAYLPLDPAAVSKTHTGENDG
jgi:putative transposase